MNLNYSHKNAQKGPKTVNLAYTILSITGANIAINRYSRLQLSPFFFLEKLDMLSEENIHSILFKYLMSLFIDILSCVFRKLLVESNHSAFFYITGE